ncbi:hypothetical protein CAEBREN_20634 [Caenorhabditis brenneri]|uniref:F-box domain-containing protein n=1 Tax=Caenorhabditis brenneri TaxID=135651 RepID=G0NJU3_CAEBE|nr:hypothetical protein CAEBREN_20634 [Caenorhabditis brenneri]
MQPIPLWKLPFVARKNVFRQMDPDDVFNLSMTSMKSKLIIMKLHKLPPANFSWHIGRHQGNFWNGTCVVSIVEDEMNLYICFVDPNINGIKVFVEDLREGKSFVEKYLTSILFDPNGKQVVPQIVNRIYNTKAFYQSQKKRRDNKTMWRLLSRKNKAGFKKIMEKNRVAQTKQMQDGLTKYRRPSETSQFWITAEGWNLREGLQTTGFVQNIFFKLCKKSG